MVGTGYDMVRVWYGQCSGMASVKNSIVKTVENCMGVHGYRIGMVMDRIGLGMGTGTC